MCCTWRKLYGLYCAKLVTGLLLAWLLSLIIMAVIVVYSRFKRG